MINKDAHLLHCIALDSLLVYTIAEPLCITLLFDFDIQVLDCAFILVYQLPILALVTFFHRLPRPLPVYLLFFHDVFCMGSTVNASASTLKSDSVGVK